MMNAKKEILLGVTGGVSAYKSADLLRRLQESGFAITVLPTQSSLNFVGAALWEALSGRKVYTDLWSDTESVPHIHLAQHSDLILIAPASADVLARLAHGGASDLLSATVTASTAPKILVPAMHPEMWLAASTQENVRILRERGFLVVEPEHGRMTGDDVGVGRYPQTQTIVDSVQQVLKKENDFAGLHVVVTAGGTREMIDPVRYIGNLSSGLQGIAFAEVANSRGAKVTLLLANVSHYSHEQIEVVHVQSTEDMQVALDDVFDSCNILVMAAAVADAKPALTSSNKLEKGKLNNIELVANPDLLENLAKRRTSQILFGFAAQTDDHVARASEKLDRKGIDFIYVNDVSQGKIFGKAETCGTIIDKTGNTRDIPEMNKSVFASIALDLIAARLRLRP